MHTETRTKFKIHTKTDLHWTLLHTDTHRLSYRMQSHDCWYWTPVAVAVTPWMVSDSRWTVGEGGVSGQTQVNRDRPPVQSNPFTLFFSFSVEFSLVCLTSDVCFNLQFLHVHAENVGFRAALRPGSGLGFCTLLCHVWRSWFTGTEHWCIFKCYIWAHTPENLSFHELWMQFLILLLFYRWQNRMDLKLMLLYELQIP